MTIRAATPTDIQAILGLVRELAVYEREPDAVKATESHVRTALFPDGGGPTTFAHVAEVEGEVVGMAVWYVTYSTWTGVNGIWLEDLFVQPGHRGSGLGRELLATLARTCVDRGYQRLEWAVLDWNEPSLAFYRSLGAVALDEWTVHRLSGDALSALGDR
jgi:GNAT superfamily N-acetyltransferase